MMMLDGQPTVNGTPAQIDICFFRNDRASTRKIGRNPLQECDQNLAYCLLKRNSKESRVTQSERF
jgi:hypothetical protein